jgi:HEAT repeat protein
MWTLAKIGTDEAIEVLVDSAQHGGHRMVRTDAIEEVGRFGISSAVGTLKGLLWDGDARIRAAAVTALGRAGDAECVCVVVSLFDDPEEKVREAAHAAYSRLVKRLKATEG